MKKLCKSHTKWSQSVDTQEKKNFPNSFEKNRDECIMPYLFFVKMCCDWIVVVTEQLRNMICKVYEKQLYMLFNAETLT